MALIDRLHLKKAVNFFYNRDRYTLEFNTFWRENRLLLLASLLTFVGALLYRSWPNFLHPGLYVEDTSHYFNYYYGGGQELKEVLRTPNGYHSLLTNLIAYVVAYVDVRIQPTLYLWTGTLFAVIACMVLPCSGLLKNRYVIFIAPILLGMSGLNHLFYYITLTYQIYVLVIILIGFLFWQPLSNTGVNIFLFIILSLLVWSGPYSVLVVPFSCCFILFFRGKTVFLVCLCAVTLAYTLSVTEHLIMLGNLLEPEIYRIWFDTLICKVFFMGLKGGIGTKKVALAIIFFLSVIAIFRRDLFYLKVACLFMVLINSSLAALFLSKKFLISLRILPCYLVIAQFCWLAFVLFTFDRLLSKKKVLYHGGIIVSVLAVLFVIYDNGRNPSKMTIPLMSTLPDYLQTVHEAERSNLAEQNRIMEIELGDKSFRPVVRVGKRSDWQIPVERVILD